MQLKEQKFTITNSWVLEVGGGIFFAFFLRWSQVLFMIRVLFESSSRWSGLAGPEYIAILLGFVSRKASAAFAVATACTGGLNFFQLLAVLCSLGLWEWLEQRNEKKKKSDEEVCCVFIKVHRTPLFWPLVVLFGMGWIGLHLNSIL